MAIGKPRNIPEITEVHLKQIRTLAGYGLTMPQIAGVIGLARASFYEYMARDPRIKEALETGRAIAAGIIGEALFKQAKGGNVRAIQYYEATRLGVTINTPVPLEDESNEMDYSLLDDDDLLKLEEITSKAKVKEDYEDAEFEEVNEEPTE